MGNKTTKNVAKNATKQAEERLQTIRQFNVNNAGDLWIDPEKIPTQEDIDAAKKEFEDTTKALQEKNDYLIADANNSVRVATFLKDYISNAYWSGRYFVGIVNFDEYITKFLEEANEEPKDLVMEYGPMQFAFLMLENCGGRGLEEAKAMAEKWNEYVPIYDTFRDHIEWYKAQTEKIKKLQQKWGMMSMGYYLVILEPDNGVTNAANVAPAPECAAPEEAAAEKPCECEDCGCERECDAEELPEVEVTE